MNDSNAPDGLAGKHDAIETERLEAVKRWVAYIRSEPPEVWGAEQNALVDTQIASGQAANLDAEHYRRIKQGRDRTFD